MADTKITALAAITTVDPAADVLPIVDISDTSMAASGTTKKITTNQLLGAGGTATLASATITGAATVGTTLGVTGVTTLTGNAFANGSYAVAAGTPGAFANAAITINNRSGVGDLSVIALGYRPNGTLLNSASYIGYVGTNGSGNGLGDLIFGTRSVTTDTAPTERYRIDSTGISTWSVAGTTAMTLNSTGLGIGIAPDSAKSTRLSVYQTGDLTDETAPFSIGNTAASGMRLYAGVNNANEYVYIGSVKSGTGYRSLILQPNGGNVGVGVTPSAWGSTAKAVQIGSYSAIYNDVDFTVVVNNAFFNGTNNIYRNTAPASQYYQNAGSHVWRNAPSGTAGNAITFTQAMTLDASGNLLVGVTSGTLSRITSSFLSSSGNVGIKLIDSQSNNTAKFADFFNGTGTLGSITNNNNAGVLYNVTSDKRLKENISDSESASSLIDSLQVRQFDWKVNNSHQRYGFIAQELVTVVPEAVYQPTNSDEMMAVDYSKLVPMLIKEIQSLRARVQTLEAR